MEKWIEQLYDDTKKAWIENGNDERKYAIFYSPIIYQPKIMIIGYNPGGGKKDSTENEVTVPAIHDYFAHEGTDDDYKLAKRMRKIFDCVGIIDKLKKSVKLNLIFFRSKSIKEFKINKELIDFCNEKIKEIIEKLQPQIIITEGFVTFDKLLNLFDGEEFNGKTNENGRLIVKIGRLKSSVPVIGLLHPSMALSIKDLKAMGAFIKSQITYGFSKDDTICVYTEDKKVIELIEHFAKKKSLKICYAEDETDLIAVPCLFAVVDINKLDEGLFDYIDVLIKEDLLNEEKFVSHTIPESENKNHYAKYFEINSNLSFADLENINNSKVNQYN